MNKSNPDLRDWIENAEVRYRKVFTSRPLPAGAIGGVQVFAYHEKHDPENVPVICIGSNYSQGPGQTGQRCETDLGRWLGNYLKLRARFEQEPQLQRQWVARGWSSARFPSLPAEDECFFVMTNLCPWITNSEWRTIEPQQSIDLLSASKLLDQFLHVEELIACLLQQRRDFTILAHGVNDNILDALKQFLVGRDRWLLYANLTRPYKNISWDDAEQSFKFRNPSGQTASDEQLPSSQEVLEAASEKSTEVVPSTTS